MNVLSKRAGIGVVACGAAAVVALTSSASLASASRPASGPVVLVNCGTAQVKPSSFVLACADDGAYLTDLHWVSWSNVAFGTGIEHLNACYPACVNNLFYTYPVLITVWRAAVRAGHAGQKYFSRMTVIHTGKLSRKHERALPVTQTFPLFPSL